MPLYNQMPVRLEATLISAPPVEPVDANTGLPIAFWRAQGLQVNVGIFAADGSSVDLSNLEYLQLIIQPAFDSLVPSITKTIEAGDIIPVITRANWQAGYAQQAAFVLSKAETDLSLAGALEATYWLMLVGRTTGGANIVYAAGSIRVFNPGSVIPAPPTTPIVSAHEQANGGGNSVVNPTSQLHIEEITVTGAAETRDVVVMATGLVAGARVSLRFILPATAAINLRIFDQATSGALLTTLVTQADGFLPAARVELWFDGANLKRDFLLQPAFGQQT